MYLGSQMKLLFLTMLLFVGSYACGTDETSNTLSGSDSDGSNPCVNGSKFECDVEAAIFLAVNSYRAQNGVANLSYDGRMAYVARDWSSVMMRGEAPVGHDGFPNARIASLEARFSDTSDIAIRAENVAFFSGFPSSEAREVANRLMNQWIDSPGHRANMLNANWQVIGCGVKKNGSAVYGTQIFGTFEIN